MKVRKPHLAFRKSKVSKKKLQIILIITILGLVALGVAIFLKEKPQFYFSLPQPGRMVAPSSQNDTYIDLVNQLAQSGLSISYINFLDNNTIEASLSSGIRVIFSTEKDIKEEVASLQLILGRFKIEGRKVNKIDLRFKNAFIE